MTRAIVFCIAAALAPAQQLEVMSPPVQQQPPTTGTSSITGTVVNNATGEPVKKAMISLGGPISGNPPMVVTDASGGFAFRRLPTGTYNISAQRDGFDQNRGMIAGDSQKEVTVEADQEKGGVEMRLWPNGSISGRLTDENGDAAPNCTVSALPVGDIGSGQMRGSASSDDRGEYRIENLPAGRYLVYQHCYQNLIAPHGFLERGDPRTPLWAWAPGYFGGAESSSGAAAVSVSGGVEVRGIDFHQKIVNAYPVQIQVIPDDSGIDVRNAMVRLLPRGDAATSEAVQISPAMITRAGAHTFNVVSGSYMAVVDVRDGNRQLHGETPVDVGEGSPPIVRVQLSAAITISGDVVSDDSANATQGPVGFAALVALNPSQGNMVLSGQPAKDGSFTIAGVLPGRYRLQVQGQPSTVKSVTLAGNAVSPEAIDIGPGVAGPLHVVVSVKQTQMHVAVTDLNPEQVAWIIALPKTFRPGGPFMNAPIIPAQKEGVTLPATPGAYTVYAIECAQPWPLLNDPAFLALADRGKAVQVPEQGDASVTVSVITRQELRTALEQAGASPQ